MPYIDLYEYVFLNSYKDVYTYGISTSLFWWVDVAPIAQMVRASVLCDSGRKLTEGRGFNPLWVQYF